MNDIRFKFLIFLVLIVVSEFGVRFTAASQAAPSSQPVIQGLKLSQSVAATLQKQPDILIQKQNVVSGQGALQIEQGAFDPNFTTDIGHTREESILPTVQQGVAGASTRDQQTTTTTMGLIKKTRQGIQFGPNIQLTRDSGLDDPTLQESDSNQSSVRFSIVAPLLKGGGKASVGAQEMAAQANLEAIRLTLQNIISQSIQTTATAYWAYLAAIRQLEIRQEIEAESGQLLKEAEALVAGGERPRADLDTFRANLSAGKANRIAAEHQAFAARQNLGLAMGLAYQSIDELAPPADTFPKPDRQEVIRVLAMQDQYVDIARLRRGDLRASKTKEKMADILLAGASHDLLPQLDVHADVGYGGLQEGGSLNDYFQSLSQNTGGPNYAAGIQLTIPFGNNAAQGNVVQYRSQLGKIRLQTSNLDRQIRSGIVVAVNALITSVQQLEENVQAVAQYRAAVKNTKAKFGMGAASVMDVINTENYLNQARLNLVSSQQAYAGALVSMAYQTGLLVQPEDDDFRVALDLLIALPPIER